MKRYEHCPGAAAVAPVEMRAAAELRRRARHGIEPVAQDTLDGIGVLVCSWCLYPVRPMPEPAPTLGLFPEQLEMMR